MRLSSSLLLPTSCSTQCRLYLYVSFAQNQSTNHTPQQQEEFFLRFAEFEEIVKEHDRARAIYKYALDQLPRGAAQTLYARFVAFEKQHGSRCVWWLWFGGWERGC